MIWSMLTAMPSSVPMPTPADCVAVVATTPLTTDEPWTPFAPGGLRVFADGAARA
jgi:glutamine amidotransferase